MKYYVRTGDFKFVIDRPTAYEAAFYGLRNALLRDKTEKKDVGLVTIIREDKFAEPDDDIRMERDHILFTEELLRDMGIADYFEFNEAQYQKLLENLREEDEVAADFLERLLEQMRGG